MSTRTRKTLTAIRAACGLMALASVLFNTACSKTVAYTYVYVHVQADVRPALLATVVSCEFQVLGAEMTDGFSLKCPENNVPPDLGTFGWTSQATTGSLQFRVRIYAVNRVVVGEGITDAIPVSPGKVFNVDLHVLEVEPTTGPDAGDDDASAGDVGVDTGTDSAATTDATVDGGADAAADQATATDAAAGTDQAADAGTTDAATLDAAADSANVDAPASDAADAAADAG